jgi:hypothetical protein
MKWHSPQCKQRAKGRLGGCWCHLIRPADRKRLDAEYANRSGRPVLTGEAPE